MQLDETDIQKRKRHGDTLWPVGILGPGAHIDIIMGMEACMNGPVLNTHMQPAWHKQKHTSKLIAFSQKYSFKTVHWAINFMSSS